MLSCKNCPNTLGRGKIRGEMICIECRKASQAEELLSRLNKNGDIEDVLPRVQDYQIIGGVRCSVRESTNR